jgi:glycosyltransferase involved in cell wall biosynthesis
MGSQPASNYVNARPLVSVAVSTYKRGKLIKYLLEGLTRQTYKNFELVVVLKPSGDETEKILKKYSADMPINLILQKSGSITNAYNLAIKNSKGKIIVFLDDDAVPYPNLLDEYVKTYQKYEGVGAISGPAESATIKDGKVVQIPKPTAKQVRHYEFPWSRPLKGLSNWLIYFGKDGLVHHRQLLKKGKVEAIYPSFLFMGANMSFKRDAIEGLEFDENNFLGFTCEQLFSYKIWRRGYNLIYNPEARVLHIVQEDTLGRFYKKPKKAALRDAEFVLSFPFMRLHENVSFVAYSLAILTILFAYILNMRRYGLSILLHRTYGLLYGFVVACGLVISNSLEGNFSKTNALAALTER